MFFCPHADSKGKSTTRRTTHRHRGGQEAELDVPAMDSSSPRSAAISAALCPGFCQAIVPVLPPVLSCAQRCHVAPVLCGTAVPCTLAACTMMLGVRL